MTHITEFTLENFQRLVRELEETRAELASLRKSHEQLKPSTTPKRTADISEADEIWGHEDDDVWRCGGLDQADP